MVNKLGAGEGIRTVIYLGLSYGINRVNKQACK